MIYLRKNSSVVLIVWVYLFLAHEVYFLSPKLNFHLICVCFKFLYLPRWHLHPVLVSDEATCLKLNFDWDQSEESATRSKVAPQQMSDGIVKTGASLQGLQQVCGRKASD